MYSKSALKDMQYLLANTHAATYLAVWDTTTGFSFQNLASYSTYIYFDLYSYLVNIR